MHLYQQQSFSIGTPETTRKRSRISEVSFRTTHLAESVDISQDGDQTRGMPPIFGFLGKVSAQGKKAMINSVLLLLTNVVFISCSALVFSKLENDPNNRLKMIEERLIILDDLKYFLGLPVDHDNVNGTFPMHIKGHEPWDEDEFGELLSLHKTRCYKIDNQRTMSNLWNFWSAVDFCATVLTTIGYGSMYPRTTAGKWFCIIYSIIGIPVMAMYLALFSKGICYILSFCVTGLSNLLSKSGSDFKLSGFQARIVSLVILLVGLIAFVVMWGLILNKTNEKDSFLTCIYFYVITMTTVGIGDISMTEANPLVLIRVLFLFCVGLTLVTCVFNALRSVSAAHTKMLQEAGSKLKNRAQGAVIDGAQRLIKSGSQSQLRPLTKDGDSNNEFSEREEETTFTTPSYRFEPSIVPDCDPPAYTQLDVKTER